MSDTVIHTVDYRKERKGEENNKEKVLKGMRRKEWSRVQNSTVTKNEKQKRPIN